MNDVQIPIDDLTVVGDSSTSATIIAERRRKNGASEVRVPGIPETRFWAYS